MVLDRDQASAGRKKKIERYQWGHERQNQISCELLEREAEKEDSIRCREDICISERYSFRRAFNHGLHNEPGITRTIIEIRNFRGLLSSLSYFDAYNLLGSTLQGGSFHRVVNIAHYLHNRFQTCSL